MIQFTQYLKRENIKNERVTVVEVTKALFVPVDYNDVIMGTMASRITSLPIVYSTVYSGADQRKDQGSASLAFVWGIHQGPVNSPHKWPVTRKMFPFDDVIIFRVYLILHKYLLSTLIFIHI